MPNAFVKPFRMRIQFLAAIIIAGATFPIFILTEPSIQYNTMQYNMAQDYAIQYGSRLYIIFQYSDLDRCKLIEYTLYTAISIAARVYALMYTAISIAASCISIQRSRSLPVMHYSDLDRCQLYKYTAISIAASYALQRCRSLHDVHR
jgi:hypothetical protein